MTTTWIRQAAIALCLLLLASAAAATDGMNLEGYGPIAHGMGGAGMAFDNGSAALMNNPATLGLLPDGEARLDLAVGSLGPSVAVAMAAMDLSADSDATAFYMPALGYYRRGGALTYGLGVFGQGGMGTEYASSTFMAGPTGEDVLSQVSVGRAMLPLAYAVNEKLTLAATLDFVWGGMDLMMPFVVGDGGDPAPGSFMDFMGSHVLGEADVSAGFGQAINDMMTGGMLAADDYARIEFADDSDFTGAAKGTGFAGKLGFVYQATPDFAVGATYHLKTAMSDWEADEAKMAFYQGDGSGLIGEAIPGKMAVEDFQWPAVFGAGVAFSPAERWVLAADYKRIQWSDTMADFTMTFTAEGGDLDGESVGITFYQDWEDQSVFNLGAAFRASELLVLRGGAVIASNPIPDEYVNPLFPAIEENHFSGGLGLNFAERQALNLSFAVAPEVEQENSNTTLAVTHSQFNFQVMYSLGF